MKIYKLDFEYVSEKDNEIKYISLISSTIVSLLRKFIVEIYNIQTHGNDKKTIIKYLWKDIKHHVIYYEPKKDKFLDTIETYLHLRKNIEHVNDYHKNKKLEDRLIKKLTSHNNIKYLLDKLYDHQRNKLFNNYCKSCGSTDSGCSCWNDD